MLFLAGSEDIRTRDEARDANATMHVLIGNLSVTVIEELSFLHLPDSLWAASVQSFLKGGLQNRLKAIGFLKLGALETRTSFSIASLLLYWLHVCVLRYHADCFKKLQ